MREMCVDVDAASLEFPNTSHRFASSRIVPLVGASAPLHTTHQPPPTEILNKPTDGGTISVVVVRLSAVRVPPLLPPHNTRFESSQPTHIRTKVLIGFAILLHVTVRTRVRVCSHRLVGFYAQFMRTRARIRKRVCCCVPTFRCVLST